MPVFLIALSLLGAFREQGTANASTPLQQLSWMAGCWQQVTGGGATIDEVWMPPQGETMLGMSRTVGRGALIGYEFMRIQSDKSGVTFFALLPKQPETPFRMMKMDRDAVVFENATHDFPQRVIYRRDGDRLIGRIEGTQDGKPRSVDYPMRRVACT